jgi:hypothetical protein
VPALKFTQDIEYYKKQGRIKTLPDGRLAVQVDSLGHILLAIKHDAPKSFLVESHEGGNYDHTSCGSRDVAVEVIKNGCKKYCADYNKGKALEALGSNASQADIDFFIDTTLTAWAKSILYEVSQKEIILLLASYRGDFFEKYCDKISAASLVQEGKDSTHQTYARLY